MDAVLSALKEGGVAVRNDPSVRENLRILTEYMVSGQWLRDYEQDEAGAFPPELKRGVLAQDTLYDLLSGFESKDAE